MEALITRGAGLNVMVATAKVYAELRLALKQQGKPIPDNDLWIAALCVEHQGRFERRKTGKSGYAPACANEWVRGICEKPRIRPHHAAMVERLAEITGLDPKRLSVKATTTETLGFTGREEGIAGQAVATILLPDS